MYMHSFWNDNNSIKNNVKDAQLCRIRFISNDDSGLDISRVILPYTLFKLPYLINNMMYVIELDYTIHQL